MEYKIEYINIEDKQSIMDENADKFLYEEQNVKEGNFLIFGDVPFPLPNMDVPVIYRDVSPIEFETLKTELTNLQNVTNFLLMG